jgi:hypothetical protein
MLDARKTQQAAPGRCLIERVDLTDERTKRRIDKELAASVKAETAKRWTRANLNLSL